MKKISYKIFSIILLFYATGLYGQEALDNFYYYQGEKFFLEINTQTISISFEDKNSIHSFSSISSNSIQLSEIVEDHTRSIVNPIDDRASGRSGIKTFYTEVSTKTNASPQEYIKQIELYNNRAKILMASPTYKTKEGGNLGLSNNFYVKLKDQKDVDLLYKKAKEMNVEVLGHNEYMPLWFTLSVVSPQKFNALNLANIFHETGLFESAEPAFIYHDLQTSSDPFFNDQWSLKNTGQNGGISGIDINIEEAWDLSTGNNIKVAVIDQGIELDHPDLINNISGTGYDAQTGTTPSQVWGAHGVACAGIIGATKDNNIGVAGVASNSNLISVSASFSGTSYEMLANGMNWAWQNGADVISNSYGGGGPSNLFDNAVNNALSNGRNGLGCIIVFSSGNDNVNGAQYPSKSNPLILCVGAIDRCGVRSGRADIIPQSCDPWGSNSSPGSSYGAPLDIVAGGSSIPSTYSQGTYTPNFSGTSAACPYVAGVAALVLSVDPNLTVYEVNDIIEQSAQKVRTDLYTYSNTSGRTNGTWNNQLGYGLVDAYQAVLLAQNYNCVDELSITTDVPAGDVSHEEAITSITASNTIQNGAEATYNAGTEVTLSPGFHAKNGSIFRAYIEECSENPVSRIASAAPALITYEKYDFDDSEEQIESDFAKEDMTESDFIIYPNPTTGKIQIKHTYENTPFRLVIRSHTGKLILEKNIETTDSALDLGHLSAGVYIVTLMNGDNIFSERLIISN